VRRTFLTARSVELDAVLVAGVPPPAKDAVVSKDAKAGGPVGGEVTVDPRVALLVAEAYRHAKVIGAWGQGPQTLAAAGCPADAPGVVVADDPQAVLAQVVELLANHRVWERFPTTQEVAAI
jgi:catalase